jgi:transposase-like protein
MKDETEKLLDELIAQLGNKKDLLEAQDKLFKRGVENLLKAELSSHLGYAPYEKTEDKKVFPNGKPDRFILY